MAPQDDDAAPKEQGLKRTTTFNFTILSFSAKAI
jgi:hypothetical protein